MEDIFYIQEKVAAAIVQALQLRLSPDEKQILKKRFTNNTKAYQLYLQGRFFWNKRSEEGLKTAIRCFEKAIEKDPQYALAWAGIADSYSLLGEYGNIPRSSARGFVQLDSFRSARRIDANQNRNLDRNQP